MQDNSLPSVSYKQEIFSDLVHKDIVMQPLFGSVTIRFRFRDLSGVHTGIVWEQELTNVAYGTNSIQLNNAIKEMLDAAALGDSFNVQIVGKYEYPGLPSYEKSYPDTPYVYIPIPIY